MSFSKDAISCRDPVHQLDVSDIKSFKMTNSVKTAKQALRKELRLRLSSLSDSEKQKQSDYVAQTVGMPILLQL